MEIPDLNLVTIGDSIYDNTIETINPAYRTIYNSLTSLEATYANNINQIYDYYNSYAAQLSSAIDTYVANHQYWQDFLTTTQTYSAKWLQPFTIFYPILFQNEVSDDDVNTINDWLRKYFPIKNDDGTLNYVENQKIIVNCYTYKIEKTIDHVIAQPTSRCICATQSGTISLHCQTLVTGGWITCSNASYYCSGTVDCYPSARVNCWYITPYLHQNGTEIPKGETTTQTALSQIKANISMNYEDRREDSIQTLIFQVLNCDWGYFGRSINF